MRDEEVPKILSDMSFKRNISAIMNSSTEQFNRRPSNDDITNNFLDLDNRSSPTIERLSNEEANWQHEAEQFTPRIFVEKTLLLLLKNKNGLTSI